MNRALVLSLSALFLVSCQSTAPDGAAASDRTGLQVVAGTWQFSHAGPSPVHNADQPDPKKLTEKSLKGTRISIDESGNASMVAMGKSGTFKVEVLEETPLYIKVGSPEAREGAMTFDKKSRLLIYPIDVNGGEGTMAAYFRKSR